ncbi:hypothetical protein ACIG3E_37285 [Streptomyces sp. NPDC053474]|uniref:hypothetical protein n=1 Tax=Streptomyces sp. NPDC053474 TaxID=3365704 RepID=UPI0037CF6BE4
MHEPLLVIDSHPWYDTPRAYDAAVGAAFGALGFRVLGVEEIAANCDRLVKAVLRSGDLVVLPLMSGALLAETVRRRAEALGAMVLALPLSRHPFVTLSADDQETLADSCAAYARSSSLWVRDFGKLLRRARHRVERVVFLDSNSATGKDFVLFGERARRCLGASVPLHFSVLISETAEDDAYGPGHRGGRKLRQPDSAALRLVGSNTKFLSHLRFLQRDMTDQIALVDGLRAALPDLTAYWDTVPADLQSIHDYRASTHVIHTKRLHIRFAADDEERATTLSHHIGELDRAHRLTTGSDAMARRAALLTTWHRTLGDLAER